MNEKTAKIKYLENGTFKEMEVEEAIKEILDYIYPDKEYEYFSKGLLEDEISIIKKTLSFVNKRVNQLLQEIEKEKKKVEETINLCEAEGSSIEKYWWKGYLECLNDVEQLIKKAFEVSEK